MNLVDELYLQHLKQQYQLSDETVSEILTDIIATYTYNKTPSDTPTVIILGAQPGAGKTEVQKEGEYRLSRNAVICNADNFRDFHPKATELKKQFPQEYPAITVEYAHRWNDQFCRYCRQQRLNYIMETTFSSGERLNATIRELKQDGYRVELMLLAVDPRLSLLGTHMRYEASLAHTGTGRQVSTQAHQSRFDAIFPTLTSVQQARLYDDLFIYTRSVTLEAPVLTEGVSLISHNAEDPLAVFQKEVNKPWPEKLTTYFDQQCNQVLQQMRSRNAPEKEVDAFKKNLGMGKAARKRNGQNF